MLHLDQSVVWRCSRWSREAVRKGEHLGGWPAAGLDPPSHHHWGVWLAGGRELLYLASEILGNRIRDDGLVCKRRHCSD